MTNPNLIPMIIGGQNDRTTCPTCGMAVRLVRRTVKHRDELEELADHYEAIIVGEEIAGKLREQDPVEAEMLRRKRKGLKTVAMVGMAPSSCSLAPFDEPEVEIWGLNEAHAFQWMKRADRWFQIHNSESWKRYIAKRDVRGHFDWLKKNPWGIPIYMQYAADLVPNSVAYPLHEVVDIVFKNFQRGTRETLIKYFTSSFAYMMGIAVLEGFQRIEVYGFEMTDDIEYLKQKACAEFWVGWAMGHGIQVYTPEGNHLLYSTLYGGNEQGEGW